MKQNASLNLIVFPVKMTIGLIAHLTEAGRVHPVLDRTFHGTADLALI